MDCPPVSPGGGSEVPEALLEPGVGAGLTGSPWWRWAALMSPALAGEFFTTSTTWEPHIWGFCFFSPLSPLLVLVCFSHIWAGCSLQITYRWILGHVVSGAFIPGQDLSFPPSQPLLKLFPPPRMPFSKSYILFCPSRLSSTAPSPPRCFSDCPELGRDLAHPCCTTLSLSLGSLIYLLVWLWPELTHPWAWTSLSVRGTITPAQETEPQTHFLHLPLTSRHLHKQRIWLRSQARSHKTLEHCREQRKYRLFCAEWLFLITKKKKKNFFNV